MTNGLAHFRNRRNQTKTLLGIETQGKTKLTVNPFGRNQTKTLLGIETDLIDSEATALAITPQSN